MGKRRYKLPPKKSEPPVTVKQQAYLKALEIRHETLTGRVYAIYTLLITTLIPLVIYWFYTTPGSNSSQTLENIFANTMESFKNDSQDLLHLEQTVAQSIEPYTQAMFDIFKSLGEQWKMLLEDNHHAPIRSLGSGDCVFIPAKLIYTSNPCSWGSHLKNIDDAAYPMKLTCAVETYNHHKLRPSLINLIKIIPKDVIEVGNALTWEIIERTYHHHYKHQHNLTDDKIFDLIHKEISYVTHFDISLEPSSTFFEPMAIPPHPETLPSHELFMIAHEAYLRLQVIQNILQHISSNKPIKATQAYLYTQHHFIKYLKLNTSFYISMLISIATIIVNRFNYLQRALSKCRCQKQPLSHYNKEAGFQAMNDHIQSYVEACISLDPWANRLSLAAYPIHIGGIAAMYCLYWTNMQVEHTAAWGLTLLTFIIQLFKRTISECRQHYFGRTLESRLKTLKTALALYSTFAKQDAPHNVPGTELMTIRLERFGSLTLQSTTRVFKHVLDCKQLTYKSRNHNITLINISSLSMQAISSLRTHLLAALIAQEAVNNIQNLQSAESFTKNTESFTKNDEVIYNTHGIATHIRRPIGTVPDKMQADFKSCLSDHITIHTNHGQEILVDIKVICDLGEAIALLAFQHQLKLFHRKSSRSDLPAVHSTPQKQKQQPKRTGTRQHIEADSQTDAIATAAPKPRSIYWKACKVRFYPNKTSTRIDKIVRRVEYQTGLYFVMQKAHNPVDNQIAAFFNAIILNPRVVPHSDNNGIVFLQSSDPIARLPNKNYVAKLKNRAIKWRVGLRSTTTPSGDTLLYGSFDDLIDKTKIPKKIQNAPQGR